MMHYALALPDGGGSGGGGGGGGCNLHLSMNFASRLVQMLQPVRLWWKAPLAPSKHLGL